MTGAAIIGSLRSGSWLTPQRLRGYPIMLILMYLLVITVGFATANGPLDALGRQLGTDFSQVWVAGRSVLAGHPAQPYDVAAHIAAQRRVWGEAAPYYSFQYPPYFLALAAAFALLPYLPALIVWQSVTLSLYLITVWRILPSRRALVGALAFPATLVNLGHGQNGFLTACLLGGGLFLLRRRPVLAGILIGLLAYKPQFGLLLPLALLMDRRWTTIAAAAVTVLLSTIATWIAFSGNTWLAFRTSLTFSRTIVLELGNSGWEKFQSAFSAVRAVGGGIVLAYWVQGMLTAIVFAVVLWLWRAGVDWRLKSAALLTAALLGTPYVLDYDMVVLAPALALFVSHGLERGFAPWERSILALVWMVPLLARSVARITLIPLGLLAMLGLFAIIAVRGLRERTITA